MESKIYKLIEQMADAMANMLDVQYPINDMGEVINKLNGSVVVDYTMSFFSNVIITKRNNSSFQISVSFEHTVERQNFEVAKALFILMQRGLLVDDIQWQHQPERMFYETISQEGYHANEFAKCFLMPKEKYYMVFKENCNDISVDTKKIAEYFYVPVDAARSRGMDLNLIDPFL